MLKYFLFVNSEDGLQIHQYDNEEQLKKDLEFNKNYKSGNAMGIENFLDYLPSEMESGFFLVPAKFGDAVLIKGKVILPKPKEVVIDYDFQNDFDESDI